ncbi:MAG: DNA polymerase III subunit alpha [Armatimonadota bacterium]
MNNFVHLHLHTEYSLLDGACRIKDVIKKAKEFGMDSVAVTDHGTMYGTVEFVQRAQKEGIKPIVGCELYQALRTRFDRSPRIDDDQYHLLILAKDNEGYKNLLKLVTLANLEGFYYKPRVDKELLSRYSKGLIAGTACLAGEVPKHIMNDNLDMARQAVDDYIQIFGKENFFLELQDHHIPEQKKVNKQLIEFSKEFGLDLIATNDNHYMTEKEAQIHDILLCIQTQKTVQEEKRMRFPGSEFYFKNEDQMKEIFREAPQAVFNTRKVADMCNVSFDFEASYLPDFKAPEGLSLNDYLRELCGEGLKKFYPGAGPEIKERLEYELSVISGKNLAAYFLIVWDFIRFAKNISIPVGPGRGSAAGSLIAYLLGITTIDPIKYSLIFERFLNPERKSLPDIDTDFCIKRRDEVIKYVTEKYGEDKVSQIITFGRMKARAAVRDVGRALALPLNYVDRIAKAVPFGLTINQALETPDFGQIYNSDKEARNLIDLAKGVEGLARNASIHAAGVVISKEELTECVPLQRMNNNEIVAQFEMNSLADIGLLKMDFLGLRNLTVMDKAVKIIREKRGVNIDLDELPLDNKKTYKLLQNGHTYGVFQLESSGMRRYLMQLKPERFEDIIAMIALYRPGALSGGTVDDFISIKHGRKKVNYMHPALETILKETYGVIVYQEQVMQIANELAGYSMAQADELRKAMGKKKPEVMAKQREIFIKGSLENKVDQKVAEKIFELIEYFAGYGFNKSHATAYAVISYQTAYLKANYLKEYMAALLTSVADNTDKLCPLVRECRKLKLEILPPCVNDSEVEFSVTEKGLRWGLGGIKNAGASAVESIVNSRKEKGLYKNIFDLCSRVDLRLVNKRVIESIIKSGAMDLFEHNRATLIEVVDQALEYGAKFQKEEKSGQFSLFGEDSAGEEEFIPKIKPMEEFSDHNKLLYEKELLGMFVSQNPLDKVLNIWKKCVDTRIEELTELKPDSNVVIAGMITSFKKIFTKTNQSMAFLTLEDFTSSAEVIVLPRVYEKTMQYLKEDAIIAIGGRIDSRGASDFEGDDKPEGAKIIANDIKPIEDYKSLAGPESSFRYGKSFGQEPRGRMLDITEYHIKIADKDKQILEKLKLILTDFKGENPVYFHIESTKDKSIVPLGKNYWVKKDSNLEERIQELLGKDMVWKK